MNDQQEAIFTPSQNVNSHWRVSSIKVFIEAFQRYQHLLKPHNLKGNEEVIKEIDKAKRLIKYFRERIKGKNDYQLAEVPCMGSTFGLIRDVLYKYWNFKKAELKKKKVKTFVKGALEGEEKEVEKIREILQVPFWQRVTRGKTLVPDFTSQAPKKKERKKPMPHVKQNISIKYLHGQAVFGVNYGKLVQTRNKKLVKVLQSLLDEIVASEGASEEIKDSVIGDIRTIESQVIKPKPDKNILKKAWKSLDTAIKTAKIAELTQKAVPYIEKIKDWIEKLQA